MLRSYRSTASQFFQLFALCCALCTAAGCDRTGDKQRRPDDQRPSGEPGQPPAAGSVRAPAPPLPPYVGRWRGSGGYGELDVSVDEHQLARGAFRSAQGAAPQRAAQVTGMYDAEQDVLRVRVVGQELYGSGVWRRDGEAWAGKLRASLQPAGPLMDDAGPFGEEWDVVLTRAPAP